MPKKLSKFIASLKKRVHILCTWQKATPTRMRILSVHRDWRHWAIPLGVDVHCVSFIGITILRVDVLCFTFEYEVQKLDQEGE